MAVDLVGNKIEPGDVITFLKEAFGNSPILARVVSISDGGILSSTAIKLQGNITAQMQPGNIRVVIDFGFPFDATNPVNAVKVKLPEKPEVTH